MRNLYEELLKYTESGYYPFHMPGHKRRDILAFQRRGINMSDIHKFDITEIEGFDNLHHADGLLLELQRKAANIYHAEESFFLVNGSTGGILSAVSAVAKEGDKILIARNCHKSVYNAVLLNRLKTEYLWPELIEEFDIQGEIAAAYLEEKMEKCRNICGIVVTSPTYEGIISDIRKLAGIAHRYHIPLIVDEAHGAHLVLSDGVLRSAVECGADIVINSVHKTLPSLTQTALLHVQGSLIDRERLKKYLGIYQSSSPSYILMASIDNCMDFMMEQGQERYRHLLGLRKKIDERAIKFSYIRFLPAKKNCDPGKLVISVKGTTMTGRELYRELLEKYKLQMEMALSTGVLGILTVMDCEEGVERLLNALEEIDGKLQRDAKKTQICKVFRQDSCLSIYEAEQQEKEWRQPCQAVGRISGGFIYLYPPGIPIIVPGEMISEELIRKIGEIEKQGLKLIGLSGNGEYPVLKEGAYL